MSFGPAVRRVHADWAVRCVARAGLYDATLGKRAAKVVEEDLDEGRPPSAFLAGEEYEYPSWRRDGYNPYHLLVRVSWVALPPSAQCRVPCRPLQLGFWTRCLRFAALHELSR